MFTIYLTVACLITAVLSSIITSNISRLKRVYTRLKTRNNADARIEWLEGRTKIHDTKDKVYLDKFDDLETQIENIAKRFDTREKNLKGTIRSEVREYLKQLQK